MNETNKQKNFNEGAFDNSVTVDDIVLRRSREAFYSPSHCDVTRSTRKHWKKNKKRNKKDESSPNKPSAWNVSSNIHAKRALSVGTSLLRHPLSKTQHRRKLNRTQASIKNKQNKETNNNNNKKRSNQQNQRPTKPSFALVSALGCLNSRTMTAPTSKH